MKQLTFRLKPGQHLKEEIEKSVKENNIKAGVLLSIVGSLENVVLRMAGAKPNKQKIKKWHGPFEIVSGTGTISFKDCHIHISVSDKDGKVIGGHLKDGSIVGTTVEVVLGVFKGVNYKRVVDPSTRFKELFVE